MTSDLTVPLYGGTPFFKVHALDHSILTEPLLEIDYGLLDLLLAAKFLIPLFLL